MLKVEKRSYYKPPPPKRQEFFQPQQHVYNNNPHYNQQQYLFVNQNNFMAQQQHHYQQQQQQQYQYITPNVHIQEKPQKPEVVDVYKSNLQSAMNMLNYWVKTKEYNFVALDTEFPGVFGEQKEEDDAYSRMSASVNETKIIQLGLTLFNDKGERPPHSHTFQFNFRFDEEVENKNQSSIDLLRRSGLVFGDHKRYGITEEEFINVFESTGLLRNSEIVWIAFHGIYDFGYLVKMFSKDDLRASFLFDLLMKHLFPFILDLKCLAMEIGMYGGLSSLAETLNVKRKGKAHLAGSDACLTGDTFYALLSSSVESRDKYWSMINKVFALNYEPPTAKKNQTL